MPPFEQAPHETEENDQEGVLLIKRREDKSDSDFGELISSFWKLDVDDGADEEAARVLNDVSSPISSPVLSPVVGTPSPFVPSADTTPSPVDAGLPTPTPTIAAAPSSTPTAAMPTAPVPTADSPVYSPIASPIVPPAESPIAPPIEPPVVETPSPVVATPAPMPATLVPMPNYNSPGTQSQQTEKAPSNDDNNNGGGLVVPVLVVLVVLPLVGLLAYRMFRRRQQQRFSEIRQSQASNALGDLQMVDSEEFDDGLHHDSAYKDGDDRGDHSRGAFDEGMISEEEMVYNPNATHA